MWKSPSRKEQGFLFQPISGSQEGRGHETSYQFQGPEQVHPIHAFQNGRDAHPEGRPEGERLDGEGGSEGCILHDPNLGNRQRDAPLLHSGLPVPVHLSTIWPIMGSMGLTILVMADSKPQAVEHSQALIFLLESLSFIVHPEKTVRVHTWKIKFLGMNILSKIMRLQFPPQKIKKVWAEVAALLRRAAAPPTAREVSHLRGKTNSVEQALPPGPLYCRIIQRDLAQAVEQVGQSYETPCWLSDLAKEELS